MTTSMSLDIRHHLGVGADAARTLSALAEALGVPRRTIEAAIQEARLAGVPIVTGSGGAWIASTAQEVRQAADRLHARAIHQIETAAALRRAGDTLEPVEQPTLWEAA